MKIQGKLVDLAGVEEALEDHPLVEACADVAQDGLPGLWIVLSRTVFWTAPTATPCRTDLRRNGRGEGGKPRREENDEDGGGPRRKGS